MSVLFSHVVAFSVLFLGAIWDLKTTEVPDLLGILGVLSGIAFHGYYSFQAGSLEPLVWSLGIGLIYSVYGWGMYFLGMWGGADAFSMSILGFAAPYGLTGAPGVEHAFNLLINVMIVGFIYSLFFAFYKALENSNVVKETVSLVLSSEERIALEIILAGLLSGVSYFVGLNGILYFGALVFLIFLYRFLKVLEEEAMSFEKDVEDLEPGDVVSLETVKGDIFRQKNFIGRILEMLRGFFDNAGLKVVAVRLAALEERAGYPEIVGVKGEEIERLSEGDTQKVEIKRGTRFVPVFPIALLLTDLSIGGIYWILTLSS